MKDISESRDLSPDGEEASLSAAELEAAGQASMFGAPDPVSGGNTDNAKSAGGSGAYRVLARKYRPQTFSELIGQEPMVQTLANAIRRDRLAHAFLMTGVRGVGKTSTARLIAKALNCIGPDGKGGPTIDPCGLCEPCVAIAAGRHIDVIEMDAASHTGVDDVRDIIEAVRYAAVSARYKIYIIDEVHMLSKNAFNALLKTLEEPPAHVKFLFATTEVNKLPVTVLSRTQRFDLRRIPADRLAAHFAYVCEQEGVGVEAEALALIAAAAEGSVRDGLSILDQAIAFADLEGGEGAGTVTTSRVREMLGLADGGAQRRLLGHLFGGEPQPLLAELENQYALGVEPLAQLRGLLDVVHRITVVKAGGAPAVELDEQARAELTDWAGRLGHGQLHRLWQLLLKGYEDTQIAPDPQASLRMGLLRAMFAADQPDPGSLARRLAELEMRPAPAAASLAPGDGASAPPVTQAQRETPPPPDWSDLVAQVEERGDMRAANIMRLQVRVVELTAGSLRFSRDRCYTGPVAGMLRDALTGATGDRWTVEEVAEEGRPSLVEQAENLARRQREELLGHPLVAATLAAFPDAEWLGDEEVEPIDDRRSRQGKG